MKVLSIRQPWAWAICEGEKTIENRTWSTHYRGPLLIHASKNVDRWGFDVVESLGLTLPDDLEIGGIVGIADLVDIDTNVNDTWALPDQFHWILENARPVPFVEMPGRLGLFTAPTNVAKRLADATRQLH